MDEKPARKKPVRKATESAVDEQVPPVDDAPVQPVKTEPKPLRSEVYLSLRRTYSDGDHGPAVQVIQERMRDKGFWDGPCDGRYGTAFKKAVRSMQDAKGIRVTGEMNPWTWEALNS